MPPPLGTRILQAKLVPPASTKDAVAGVGSEIVTSFRVFPFPPIRARWTALITEFEWNHHFADEQTKGPFKYFRHRHEFVSANQGEIQGTTIRDSIEYEVGFGFLGKVIGRLFVVPQMQQTFQYRQQAVEKLLKP